jgi:hypothetical protein
MTTDDRIKTLIDECSTHHESFRLGYAMAFLTVADAVESWMTVEDVRNFADAAASWRERHAIERTGYAPTSEVAKLADWRASRP